MFASGDEGLKTSISTKVHLAIYATTHLAVSSKIDLESLGIVLETQRSHGEENVFTVDGFTLLLLTFLRSYRTSARVLT